MANSPVVVPDAVSRFFDKYIACLHKASIPEKQRRWYVKRVEDFIKTQNNRKIKSLSARDISQYFDMIGRQNKLTGWQFHQCIDAIRILYRDLLMWSAYQEVDWDFWFSSAQQLEVDHPTTARKLSSAELKHIQQRNVKGDFNTVRSTHHVLLIRFRNEIRRRSYAHRTEQSYEQWICRYILFCDGVAPEEFGANEVKSFLEYLAVNRRVSASTQNQALNALVFLYKQILGHPFAELDSFVRAKKSRHLPVVLSRHEVTALLGAMDGVYKLIAALLYGTGMRLLEGLRLRIQDIDFDYQRIHVIQAKGKKDRYVPLPATLVGDLRQQINLVETLHHQDLNAGYGNVLLPESHARKYPNAGRAFMW